MKIFEQAPEQGMIYAMFPERIIFEKYKKDGNSLILQESRERLEESDLQNYLEIHCFDDKREARAVKSLERGDIETVIDDADFGDDTYEEHVYLIKQDNMDENSEDQIGVVNYISYDESYDFLCIPNYRLKEV